MVARRLDSQAVRLLIVEDEPELREALVRRFRHRGDVVDHASCVVDAELLIAEHSYDVVVLDRQLGTTDGVVALERWRRAGVTTPVLILTARSEVHERIIGFEAGADDYLGKPFAMAELMHRVTALARRRERCTEVHLGEGDVRVDLARREVWRAGVRIPLRAREYAVLEWLMTHKGRLVTREQLRAACWDDTELTSNVEEATVASLRRKLGAPAIIQTPRGQGYIIDSTD